MSETKNQTVSLKINGQSYTAAPNETVLQVILRNGLNVPHFCYHPKLSIAGVCRMCLVDVEGARKLETSCSLPVREGMVVQTESQKVIEGREFVMEFTLVNHPTDCPDCDQAGECWLQEYYMAHDRQKSHIARDDKVTKDKHKVIGPRVILDQERCILCTRCVRFCDEITKTSELGIFNRGDQSILDVAPGKELNNPYSENVVDICPVGALTSRDFRFDGRVWFLKEANSICNGCARGCNVVLHHREGTIRRILPRVNEAVNGHFMCDAGRDVYKWVHAENRLLKPKLGDGKVSQEVSWNEAMEKAIVTLQRIRDLGEDVVAMASPHCSNEDNRAFLQFAVETLGIEQITFEDIAPRTWQGDDLLKVSDRNPNSKGVEQCVAEIKDSKAKVLSIEKFLSKLEAGKIKALLVLDQNLLETPDVKLREKIKAKLLQTEMVYFGTHDHETVLLSRISFPITTFSEMGGSFTNVNGLKQGFEKAIEPLGEAYPCADILQGFSKHLKTHSAA